MLDESSLAQQSWQQVVQQFPYHPIAHDIQTLPHIAYNSHDLGKTCNNLSNNWNDNRWMASNKTILEAKWEVYVSNQKNHLEYEAWLKTQEPIDYDKERQNLPQFYIPYYYSFNFDWTHVCSPMFLLRLQQWRVELPLTQQAQQLNLTWQTLSADYDLNHDKQIDPIGFIEVGHKRYLYTFISQAKNYHPLAVTKPYPIEAIDVWDTDKYLYNLSFSITSTFQITYTTKNNAPEILITNTSAYATQYIWQGSYFEAIRPAQTIYQKPIPSSSEPLAQALKLLFRDRKPQEVIKLLDQYVTSNDWDEAARLYLLGLALYYTNDINRSYNIYINLTNRYPNTGWAILAQEKVDYYKKHRFNHK